MKKRQLAIVVALLVGTQLALTQGTSFTFQGRLTDDTAPSGGLYDLRFTLWNNAAGPSQIGPTVTISDHPVTNGLFAVPLDFGAGAFEGSARWLQIDVRPGESAGAYTPLTPRVQVLPSPYAIYAGTAATVPWAGISGLPGGFNDGVDNDTVYSAGTGLSLVGTTFGLDTAYTDGRYVLRSSPGDIEMTIDSGNNPSLLGAFEVFNGAGAHVLNFWENGEGTIFSNLTVKGTVTATGFTGSGAGLTGVTVPDGSITTAKLANNSVTSAKVADGSIGTADLANGSVTAAKLASGVVPKFISLDTLATYIGGAATKSTGYGHNSGVYLPDGASSSTIQAAFIIPADYTPGTPLVIHVLWHTASTACNIRFAPNYISVARAGSAHLIGGSVTTGLDIVGGNLLTAASTANNSVETLIQVTSPTGANLAPGDSIHFSCYRYSNSADDTCTGSMVIQGLWITYQ